MHINELRNWLQHNGWTRDNYGNMVNTRTMISNKDGSTKDQEVRIHAQTISVRYERAWRAEPSTYDPKPKKQWLKISSDYCKNIHTESHDVNGTKFEVLRIGTARIPSAAMRAAAMAQREAQAA